MGNKSKAGTDRKNFFLAKVPGRCSMTGLEQLGWWHSLISTPLRDRRSLITAMFPFLVSFVSLIDFFFPLKLN